MLAGVFLLDALDVGNLSLKTFEFSLVFIVQRVLPSFETLDLSFECARVLPQCASLLCLLLAFTIAFGFALGGRLACSLDGVG